MIDAQVHRGPDGEGFEVFETPGGALALGHRRLSILDLSDAGRQPMEHPKTGNWISYNGEIYNFKELRKEFAAEGVELKSRCDTEVILHAYAKWGMRCFAKLRGMFAIAIFDRQRKRLVLARDPMGIKPLYYCCGNKGFAFASELLALRAGGVTKGAIDQRALAGLLAYGSVPGPLTMFEDVRLLPPGTHMEVDLAQGPNALDSKPETFWSFPREIRKVSRDEAVAVLRERLSAAVNSHLISDVPVGIFLSSGMDSTAITALASKGAAERVNTFTIGLANQPELDENPVAEETAKIFGTNHRNIVLGDDEISRQASSWFGRIDQPSIDGLNTFVVSWAVRQQGIKVALSGLGGDEIFGGYKTFRQVPRLLPWMKMAGKVPGGLRSAAVRMLFAKKTPQQRIKASEYLHTRATVAGLALRRRRLFTDRENEELGFAATALGLSSDFLVPDLDLDGELVGMDPVSAISYIESRFYMCNTLLRDSDVYAMAHGLETRVPMLDQDLVAAVQSIPGQMRLKGRGANKPLMYEVLGEQVFRDIPFQRKRGFALPYAMWMAGPLREQFEDMLGEVKKSGLLQASKVDHIWRDFLADKRATNWTRPWLLGVLGAWLARLQ
jgi:asparagine synthase (glutamine-hydrolysing)